MRELGAGSIQSSCHYRQHPPIIEVGVSIIKQYGTFFLFRERLDYYGR